MSIGIAIPGGRFSLIDVSGNEITEPETEGELVYRGPNVSLGYAECLDDLKRAMKTKVNSIPVMLPNSIRMVISILLVV